jgi:hypothetical protein
MRDFFRKKQAELLDYVDQEQRALKTTTKLLPSVIHALLDIPNLGSEIKRFYTFH